MPRFNVKIRAVAEYSRLIEADNKDEAIEQCRDEMLSEIAWEVENEIDEIAIEL